MKQIEDADECLKLPLLCWADYPPLSKNCYVHPWFTVENEAMCRISKSAFPEDGRIALYWTSNHRSESLSNSHGDIVVLTVNDNQMPRDSRYDGGRNSDLYRGKVEIVHQGRSGIEFVGLADHPMSSKLIQVARISDRVDFSKPIESNLTLSDVIKLRTQTVLLALDNDSYSGVELYGPFSYKQHEDNTVTITASKEYGYRVSVLRRSRLNYSDVRDKRGKVVGSFILASDVKSARVGLAPDRIFDWLPDKELFDAANQVISSAKDELELSRTQMRALKKAFADVTTAVAQLSIDEVRKNRLASLYSDFEFLVSLPDAVTAVTERLTNEQLADIILQDEIYPRFRKRIIDLPSVQDAIEEERRSLQLGLESERERVESELVELRKKEDDARRNYEEMQARVNSAEEEKAERERVLQSSDKQLQALAAEISKKKSEAAVLEGRVSLLNEQVTTAESNLNRVLQQISSATVSEEIIKDEMVRRIVSAINEPASTISSKPRPTQELVLDKDPDSLDDNEVISLLHKRISEDTGRSYSKNDVINYLICITQGYITTFAGRPGTGKTSLCRIIASALGLESCSRFAELTVEKGWDTYKDFIGYYNPLTRQQEKSNSRVYDSFALLDREYGTDGLHAPFLVLLDEANLSPIEHYWAPFLHACDSFERGMELTLGGDKSWNMPHWLRFLATVNSDHTTEELSPRFLDRSWVITMRQDSVEPDPATQASDYSKYLPISFERIEAIFGRGNGTAVDHETNEMLRKILIHFDQAHYPISARSKSMVNRYLSTACKVMDTHSKTTLWAPLDYAVSQKILPMLSSLPNDKLPKVAEGLIGECPEELNLTRAKLYEIMETGESSGFYQYFI